ncbi:group 1 glycosyl transferase [Candidatus Nitrosoglobus terrae]|uniref:Group 1 glycosyl transferase n=1 Tax=Candidatus Nitrosoglobus terrae TaxID=1630141 RepID=A0A1Q2SN67_9GAMM|nr:TIGR04063 family PEP-CTERM/XrtA system glycosyltransferase [Candidatus Nitrosoglobus terrae]BAW80588.1 group 1 glycosyl transferase [Candidatus Nitrosoglobus terrae]
MKILHVLDHSLPLQSGYSFRTWSILKQQRALGWETFHVTSPKHNVAAGKVVEKEEFDGFEFFRVLDPLSRVDKIPLLRQWVVIKALEYRLLKLIPIIKPDIIHAHSPALNGKAAIRAAKQFGIPVVYEVRAFWEDAAVDHGKHQAWGIRYRLSRNLETQVLTHADGIVTICEGLRSEIIERDVPSEKIIVVPNAVDVEQFRYSYFEDSQLRVSLGLEGKLVLGFLGSFYAYEGLDLLLQAFPKILKEYPNARVLLTGGGPQSKHLQRLALKLGLTDKVIFTGRVPNTEIYRYYNLVDIAVYPRLQMRLTDLVTPLKPLEAMAQGKLVVASDVGGHRELIRDGQTGSLFKAGNIEALASTIIALLGSPHCWDAFREAGRAFVETERTWTQSVMKYASLYSRLIDR